MNKLLKFMCGIFLLVLVGCKGSASMTGTPSNKANEKPLPGFEVALPEGDLLVEGQSLLLQIKGSLVTGTTRVFNWEITPAISMLKKTSGSITMTPDDPQPIIKLESAIDGKYDKNRTVLLKIYESSEPSVVREIPLQAQNLDPEPFISIANATAYRGGILQFAAELSNRSNEPVQFSWSTEDLSARAGIDFVAAKGNVILEPGQTRVLIEIPTVVGSSATSDKLFLVKLADVEGAQASDLSAVGTIKAGESLESSVSFAQNAARVDGSISSYDFEVSLDTLAPRDVVIRYNVSGSLSPELYTIRNGTVTIPSGQKSVRFRTNLKSDPLYDNDKTLKISLVGSTNAALGINREFTLTISNQRMAPQASIFDSLAVIGDTLVFPVRLNEPSGKDTILTYKTRKETASDDQFTQTYGSLIIPAGEVQTQLSVPTHDSGGFLEKSTLFMDLLSASHANIARATARGTLVSQSAPPLVEFVSARHSVPSGQKDVRITLKLSQASRVEALVPFKVSGSAIPGIDHNLNAGVVNFAPGQTEAAIEFNLIAPKEPTTTVKTLVLTLEKPSGATLWNVIESVVEIR